MVSMSLLDKNKLRKTRYPDQNWTKPLIFSTVYACFVWACVLYSAFVPGENFCMKYLIHYQRLSSPTTYSVHSQLFSKCRSSSTSYTSIQAPSARLACSFPLSPINAFHLCRLTLSTSISSYGPTFKPPIASVSSVPPSPSAQFQLFCEHQRHVSQSPSLVCVPAAKRN